jgi:beta-glucanase (GH16 family)
MKNLLNILGIKLPKYKFKMPNGYKLKKEFTLGYAETLYNGKHWIVKDNFNKDWQIGESWGNVQDNANCFFQLEGDIDRDNNTIVTGYDINLLVTQQEFYSTRINKQLHFKAGKIVSKDAFQYGIFKIRAKMPNFKYQWNAIWLCGKVQPDNKIWQEIDILENYNHNKIKFASSNKIYSQPNVHYVDKQGKHKMTSPSNKYVKHPNNRFVYYTLWWEEDFIRIYYDDYLVYECKDKSILNQFNEPMNLIINNAIEWGVELTKEDIEKISKADITFWISSVEYWSKN